MGIQDRDYWRERYNTIDEKSAGASGSAGQPPGNVYSGWGQSDEPMNQSHSPEAMLKSLTLIALLAILVFIVYQEYSSKTATEAIAKSSQVAQKAALERAHAIESAKTLKLERDRRLEAERQLQSQKSQEKFYLLQKQAADNQRRAWEKEQAWKRFYTPSSICQTEAFVECGNEHIRARRAFEAQYKG